jgi:hypothetical protein
MFGGQRQYYLDVITNLYLQGGGGDPDRAVSSEKHGSYTDPVTGRSTSEDPIRFAAGYSNLFPLDGSDPVNKTDSSGHQAESDWFKNFPGGNLVLPALDDSNREAVFQRKLSPNLLKYAGAWDQELVTIVLLKARKALAGGKRIPIGLAENNKLLKMALVIAYRGTTDDSAEELVNFLNAQDVNITGGKGAFVDRIYLTQDTIDILIAYHTARPVTGTELGMIGGGARNLEAGIGMAALGVAGVGGAGLGAQDAEVQELSKDVAAVKPKILTEGVSDEELAIQRMENEGGGQPQGRPGSAAESVSAKPPLRLAYEKEVMDLADLRGQLQAQGKGPEEIARTLNEARRQIGVKYKDLTPPDILEQIYARNLRDYGDKLGPTVDWLRAHNKTWEQIAESASKPGPWPPPWLK